jgi:hypothetical protein
MFLLSFFMRMLYSYTHFNCAVVYYSTVCFKFSVWNLYQEQLEMDSEICRYWYLKENVLFAWMKGYKRMCNCCLSVKHTQTSNFSQQAKSNRQYYHSHYLCIICAALTRLEVKGKQTFFFFVHLLSNLRVPCSYLTVVKQFYLQKNTTSEVFLFCKVHQLLIQNMNLYVSPWKGCFQDLASIIRCPESLSFNQWCHLSQHGLS